MFIGKHHRVPGQRKWPQSWEDRQLLRGGGGVSAFFFRLKVFPPGYPPSSLYQSKGTYVALLQQDWIFVLDQKNKCSKTCLGE